MTDWDNTPTRPATLDWRVLKSIISAISPSSPSHKEPLLFASCGRPACDYMSLKRDFIQHVYADGTEPQYRLSVKQVAGNPVELPVCVQLRLWTARRNKFDLLRTIDSRSVLYITVFLVVLKHSQPAQHMIDPTGHYSRFLHVLRPHH